jgi:hypothetical protein
LIRVEPDLRCEILDLVNTDRGVASHPLPPSFPSGVGGTPLELKPGTVREQAPDHARVDRLDQVALRLRQAA